MSWEISMLFSIKILDCCPSTRISPVKFCLGAGASKFCRIHLCRDTDLRKWILQKKVHEKCFFCQGEVFRTLTPLNDAKQYFIPEYLLFFGIIKKENKPDRWLLYFFRNNTQVKCAPYVASLHVWNTHKDQKFWVLRMFQNFSTCANAMNTNHSKRKSP